jgi:hypothetical protein
VVASPAVSQTSCFQGAGFLCHLVRNYTSGPLDILNFVDQCSHMSYSSYIYIYISGSRLQPDHSWTCWGLEQEICQEIKDRSIFVLVLEQETRTQNRVIFNNSKYCEKPNNTPTIWDNNYKPFMVIFGMIWWCLPPHENWWIIFFHKLMAFSRTGDTSFKTPQVRCNSGYSLRYPARNECRFGSHGMTCSKVWTFPGAKAR